MDTPTSEGRKQRKKAQRQRRRQRAAQDRQREGDVRREETEEEETKTETRRAVIGPVLAPTLCSGEKKPRQHKGLRCRRCFYLLCRDADFEFVNGRLWVDPYKLPPQWDGLKSQGVRLFCSSMHQVGHCESTTFANMSKKMFVIHPDKSTWEENFVNNPEFCGSDKIRNKLRYQTADGEAGETLRIALGGIKRPHEENSARPTDRYHPESEGLVLGVRDWSKRLREKEKEE